jgi:hypothetical protein
VCRTENDPMTTILQNLSVNQWSIPIKKIIGQDMTCDKRDLSWSSYLNMRNYYLFCANNITIYDTLPCSFLVTWQKGSEWTFAVKILLQLAIGYRGHATKITTSLTKQQFFYYLSKESRLLFPFSFFFLSICDERRHQILFSNKKDNLLHSYPFYKYNLIGKNDKKSLKKSIKIKCLRKTCNKKIIPSSFQWTEKTIMFSNKNQVANKN